MNLKSYARGIGAGLIVAALVLGIGTKQAKMSDAQVIERARELGMIEASTLTQAVANMQEANEPSVSENETETSTEQDLSGNSPVVETNVSDNDAMPEIKEPDEVTVDPILPGEDTETSTETSTKTSEEVTEGEAYELTIVRGDSSVKVARKLFEAGLVESAVEFDKYLCENGYDKIICTGTYQIPYGSTFEEMAKIITRKQ